MFDLFDPSKIFIVGVVALIVIGPKELPRVMRTVGQVVGRMRRMAADFQQQFNEAMREAELEDVRKELAAMTDAAKADVSAELETVNKELTAVSDVVKTDVSFDPAALTQHDNTRPRETAEPMGLVEEKAIEAPPSAAPNGALPDGVVGAPAPGGKAETGGGSQSGEPRAPQGLVADHVARESGAL